MPDIVTFNVLVDTFCKEGKVSEAQGVLKTMTEMSVELDVVTYNSLMYGHSLWMEVVEARKLFGFMITKGCKPNVFSYNILINGYCKAERIDEAKQLFNEMIHQGLTPNIVSYNTHGFCQLGKLREAKSLTRICTLMATFQIYVRTQYCLMALANKGILVRHSESLEQCKVLT